MPKPKNFFHLGLNESDNIVELTIRASSAQVAVKIYELLESSLIKMQQIDLENDWQQEDTNQDNDK